jgi:hypothetical protein
VGRWWGEFTGTPPNEIGVMVEVKVFAAGKLVGWAAYYLKIDEVVDKVAKPPTTPNNTYKHKHQSSNKR